MKVCADTSFLYSLYLTDANSLQATACMEANNLFLPFTPLHRHELRNAARLAVFRKQFHLDRAKAAFSDIETDIQNGILIPSRIAWSEVWDEAEALSASHTIILGIRGIDILHLAIARVLDADVFLTFDARQKEIAKRAGLKTRL